MIRVLENPTKYAKDLSIALPNANFFSYFNYFYLTYFIVFLKANYHPYNLTYLIPTIVSEVI